MKLIATSMVLLLGLALSASISGKASLSPNRDPYFGIGKSRCPNRSLERRGFIVEAVLIRFVDKVGF